MRCSTPALRKIGIDARGVAGLDSARGRPAVNPSGRERPEGEGCSAAAICRVILVDTSIRIDHLRRPDPALEVLIKQAQVLSHPFLRGELAMGRIEPRDPILSLLRRLSEAPVAKDEEVLRFVHVERLYGRGIGFIDAHLLVSTRLKPGTLLWSRDKRLATIAREFSISYPVDPL